jgi:hypothetical protein
MEIRRAASRNLHRTSRRLFQRLPVILSTSGLVAGVETVTIRMLLAGLRH